jgi:hypothetical protein
MATETTSIQVESDLADAYNSASEEDQKKVQLLMHLWLRELSTSPNLSLGEVMDMISDRAQAQSFCYITKKEHQKDFCITHCE